MAHQDESGRSKRGAGPDAVQEGGTKDFAGSKPAQGGASPPGVLGDETEEQNLNQPGDPGARIGKDEVDAAFAGDKKRPDYPDELVVPDDGGKR